MTAPLNSDVPRLRRALRVTRWWAALATLTSLSLLVATCLLSAWGVAFWQSTAFREVFATPTFPVYDYNTYAATATPDWSVYVPPPLPTPLPPPTLIVAPFQPTPQNAEWVAFEGPGPITIPAGSSRFFRFQPAQPLVNIVTAQRLQVILVNDSAAISPPQKMAIWDRSISLWIDYVPVWGHNEILQPMYVIGPSGEVFVWLMNPLDKDLTVANISVSMDWVDAQGASYTWPGTPMPTLTPTASPTPRPLP
jgi:hypothetical protein